MNPKHKEGKPCRKCGETLRYARDGDCVSCSAARSAVREATPETKAKRAAYAATPEAKAKKSASGAKYRAKPENKARAAARRATPEAKAKRVVYDAKRYVTYLRPQQIAIKPEKVAEQHLREQIEARGGMCPKFVDPSRRGAPDRMVLLPGKSVHFVEMKRAKLGKIKPHQQRYHDDLRALGYRVWVLWSKEDVDKFIAEV
jgi:hypothetical protein